MSVSKLVKHLQLKNSQKKAQRYQFLNDMFFKSQEKDEDETRRIGDWVIRKYFNEGRWHITFYTIGWWKKYEEIVNEERMKEKMFNSAVRTLADYHSKVIHRGR